MHYYQFNIADYRKDTVHLMPIEHYIYRTLIDWYYLDEKPIPKKTQSVMRRLRLITDEEELALNNVLNDFFIDTPEGWCHERIALDIADYYKKCNKNKENGKKGGRPKSINTGEKTQSVFLGNPDESETNPNHKPITNNQEPLNTSIDTNVSIVDSEKPADDEAKEVNHSDPIKIKSDIPDCPHREIIDIYIKVLPAAIHPRTWDGARMAALKARWREDKNRQRLDWWEKFFGYVSQSDFLMGRVLSINRNAFEISLDWIVKKENFSKILDGKYENRKQHTA